MPNGLTKVLKKTSSFFQVFSVMPARAGEQEMLVFGSFGIDLENERLWRGNKEIRLPPKAFSVLRYFVEHPGHLATKETLFETLWPGIHVTDAVLAEYVREIRRVLKDDAKRPRFIETVHRRGYRFIAPITTAIASLSDATGDTSSKRDFNMPVSRGVVGRERELAILQERLDAITQGEAGFVFITGSAGIGKTRLARELRDRARQRGYQWFEGRYEKAARVPYLAWVEIVKAFLKVTDSTIVKGETNRYTAHIKKLVPEIVVGLESDEAKLHGDPGSQRLRLFEALTRLFVELSYKAPLVLFIDDLQWADSIELLHYLSRSITGRRMLVIGAYRDDELTENAAVWDTILAMNRNRLFQPLPLAALDEGEIAELLSRLLNAPASSQMVGQIFKKTGGNPFFLEEVLRLLQQRKALVRTTSGYEISGNAAVKTPASIKAVGKERVVRLGKDAEQLLRMASVIGREFELMVLRELLNKQEDEIIDLLDRCEAAGLVLSQESTGEEAYVFNHDLMQEALYESIGPARRRRHHLQIGNALERLYANRLTEHYDALACHFRLGNNTEKALEYSIKAAEKAKESFSWERASQHYQQALELSKAWPENLSKHVKFLECIIEMETLLGHQTLCFIESALQLYTRLGDVKNAARMHRRIGVVWFTGTDGEPNLTKSLLHRKTAVSLLETEIDSVEKAEAHSQYSWGLYSVLALNEAVTHGQRAVEIAERLKDFNETSRAYASLVLPLALRGDLAEAADYIDRAWHASFKATDPWIKAQVVLYPLCTTWTNRGWLECWVKRMREYCLSSHITRYNITLNGCSALESALNGNPIEGGEAIKRMEDEILQRPTFTTHSLRFAGAALAVFGEWEKAEDVFVRALEVSEEGQFAFYIVDTCIYYGRFLLAASQNAKAEEVLTRGHAIAEDKGSVVQELSLLPLMCELSIISGRLKLAEQQLKRARAILAQPRPWHGLAAPVFLAQGLLASAQGNWSEALKGFSGARELEQTYGFPYNEACILTKWGQMYGETKQRGAAERRRELLAQALSIFQRCSAKKDVEKVRKALRTL
jgi:DNA-binding winged helix-turn-helix (wHTH) protein/tetratricopeptide (TPR) repeat protein